MPTFGTFNACIKVDSTELTEYDVQIDEKGKSVSCWIPSETGKNFSVCWFNTESSINTSGLVDLDGVYVGGFITLKGSSIRREFANVYTSPTTARYFSFAPITITDDDVYLRSSAPNFGEIKLVMWRVEVKQACPFRGSDTGESRGKVHERSKKLGGHCVQFGSVQEVKQTTFYETTKLEALATFIFRYRPLDILQANGIAPLPPRPGPAKRKSPEDNDDEEIEIKDFAPDDVVEGRMRKLKGELRRLEAHRSKKRKVKSEGLDRPPVVGEVIDLT